MTGLRIRVLPLSVLGLALVVTSWLLTVSTVYASTIPSGFREQEVVSGMDSPTAFAFAPDGRIFVTEQGGAVRVIKEDVLLATPFLTVNADDNGERGLLGIALHPDFPTTPYVYIYYTVPGSPAHNRLSRFAADGDVATGSEDELVDFEDLGPENHNGGAIHFGPDGKLYVAVGENADRENSQTLTNRLGKILRYNDDGTIPSDNPFHDGAGPNADEIWAWGLRNPFTFAFQPGTGRMFINDVGSGSREEINDGIAGSNYGWPRCEGMCSPTNPSFRDPLLTYPHSGGSYNGCAIVGGAFYNPTTVQFPSDFVGDYFFADLCSHFIRRYDPVTGTDSAFITDTPTPVDLHVSPDGSLYLLTRDGGRVRRFTYAPQGTFTPTQTRTPSSTPTNTLTPTQTVMPTETHTPTETLTPSVTPSPTLTLTPTVTNTPCPVSLPVLLKPQEGATVKKARVRLDWTDVPCARMFKVKLRNSDGKLPVVRTTLSKYRTEPLEAGREYSYRVVACSEFGCVRTGWRGFGMVETLK